MTDKTEALARRFTDLLLKEVGPNRMQQIVRMNDVETHPGICHSHDFCDANMPMYDAFCEVVGREPDLDSDADTALFNEAWDQAKAKHFKTAVTAA
jgi:hypothetical protein